MSILRTKVRPKVRITLRKTLVHIDFEATNKHKNVKYLGPHITRSIKLGVQRIYWVAKVHHLSNLPKAKHTR